MGEITTREYSHSLAKQFIDLLKGNQHRIYAVLGNTATSQSASTPTFTGYSDMKALWDSAAGFKRITYADVSMVIPHGTGKAAKVWSSGQGYAQYDHRVDLFTSPSNPFIGFREDSGGTYIDVYKCLFNNSDGTASTAIADEETTSAIKRNVASSQDGYFWKFMYRFPKNSVFYTTDTNFSWLPVQTLTSKPSDDVNLKQWNVQVDAVDGAIDVVTHATDFGASYTAGATVSITSNTGTGFDGKIADVTGSTKKYLDTTSSGRSAGSGYRDANVANPTGLTAIMSPIGGHGFDAERELGAKDVMVTSKITSSDIAYGSGSGQVPRFATVGLILDPIINSSSFDDILATSTTISSGTRASGNSYITSGLKKYSGKILYIDKRDTITRASANTDTIRIVLQF